MHIKFCTLSSVLFTMQHAIKDKPSQTLQHYHHTHSEMCHNYQFTLEIPQTRFLIYCICCLDTSVETTQKTQRFLYYTGSTHQKTHHQYVCCGCVPNHISYLLYTPQRHQAAVDMFQTTHSYSLYRQHKHHQPPIMDVSQTAPSLLYRTNCKYFTIISQPSVKPGILLSAQPIHEYKSQVNCGYSAPLWFLCAAFQFKSNPLHYLSSSRTLYQITI